MGLLDSVIGALGQAPGQGQGGMQGGGQALLMQVVAAMLAGTGSPGAPAAPGGGLGGMLGSVLGGALGGGAPGAGAAHGGLAGLIEQFRQAGLGDVVGSWVGTGQNLPISPDQLGGVLGGDVVSGLAERTGMSQDDLLGQLSQVLPQMVDRVTPDGHLPDGGLGDIGAILERFGGR